MSCKCSKIILVGNDIVGNSYDNPFTEKDLYDLNKYHDWGCIETFDGVNYFVHADIQVGDGNTPTYLIVRGKNLILDSGKRIITTQNSYVEVSSVWTLAEKQQLINKINDIYSKTVDIEELVKRILGLTQENFRIFDAIYDAQGNMTSCKIRIYSNAEDLNNDVNWIAEYHVSATYVGGRLYEYSVVRL